jgi:hypothetical protein
MQSLARDLLYIVQDGDYTLDFDGHKIKISDFLDTDYTEAPEFWYHGTSTAFLDKIRQHGLIPRRTSGVKASYVGFATESNPQYVYLSDGHGSSVRFAATEAAKKHGGKPLVLKISGEAIDVDRLQPDEDSKESTWRGSLNLMGSAAYDGSIDPQFIDTVEWERKR